MEDLHDSDDNLNDIDDLDAEPGWILARNRCSVALIGDSYHVRTPTIYAAGSYVILELSSSLNLVTCTLYVGRLNSMHECQCSSRRLFRNNGVKELPKRTEMLRRTAACP